ncbi:type II toxin-antitoxin system VapC family toxin [Isoptericola halotolerans]|uniref:type II toxin-antitoxin system VapC family toxin n=1 Tax=Isoptericola halotolerans TaxID=300560 RepID=UPI003890BD2A
MTAVVDASILAEYLVGSDAGMTARRHFAAHDSDLHAPDHAFIEVMTVLRGWDLGGHVPSARLGSALEDLSIVPLRRWPVDRLRGRIWALRQNISAYDAGYIALAEQLDASLLTADRHLERAAERFSPCAVELIAASTGR